MTSAKPFAPYLEGLRPRSFMASKKKAIQRKMVTNGVVHVPKAKSPWIQRPEKVDPCPSRIYIVVFVLFVIIGLLLDAWVF